MRLFRVQLLTLATCLAFSSPTSAQALPHYTPEQVDATLKNVLAKPAAARVRSFSLLVGHGLVPWEDLADLGETLTDQPEVRAEPKPYSLALVWRSISLSRLGKNREAREIGMRAIEVALAADLPYCVYLGSSAVVEAELELGNMTEALERLLSVRHMLRERGNTAAETRCLNRIASIAQQYSANTTAIGLYEQSLQIALESDKVIEAARTTLHIAGLMTDLGRYAEATERINRGLAHIEDLDSDSANSLRYSLRTLLGRSLTEGGDFSRAEAHLNSHIETSSTSDETAEPLARLAMAKLMIEVFRYEEAGQLIKEALPVLDAHQPTVIKVRFDQAVVFYQLRQFEKALETLDEILKFEIPEGRDTHNKVLSLRGKTLQKLNRVDESIESLLAAAEAVTKTQAQRERDRAVFLQAWNTLAERTRRDQYELRAREITARADLTHQRTLRNTATLAGIAGVFLVAFMTRLRYKRKLIDSERKTTLELNQLLGLKLEAQTSRLKEEMENREQLTLELERNRKSEAIAALSSGMAHDFNNLLTVVIGSNEFIRIKSGSKLDLGSLQLLRESTRAARSGADITRQLMALTRRRVQTPKSVQLRRFFTEVHGILQRTVGESVEIKVSCPHTNLCVFVDETQLTTAIINLCVNARDAMNGRGLISISVTSNEDKHTGIECAHIAVRDNGCGMTPEILEKASAPLFTTKNEGKGTGLGLSVVNRFVDDAKGSLTLESLLGQGTTVTLTLPTKRGVVHEMIPAPDLLRLDGLAIMVVEDKEAVLQSVSTTLGLLGCKVTPVNNAETARELIELNGPPELLLCDIRMPGKTNGRELAAWMRQENPSTPIVLMTGYAEGPVDDFPYIIKPFTPSELAETLTVARATADPVE